MRIVIVEDSVLLYREGIVRLLHESGHEVVGQLVDAEGLLPAIADLRPDLVVLDVRLPPTFTDEGIQAAVAIRAAAPRQPILVLSQYVEERYATELLASDSQGIGYLLKERVADVGDFVDACQRVGGRRDRARSGGRGPALGPSAPGTIRRSDPRASVKSWG